MNNRLTTGLLCLILSILFCSCSAQNGGDEVIADGDTTVSQSIIYDDTDDVLHSVYIYTGDSGDVTTTGDDITISKSDPVFEFESHGHAADKTLYVFIDGDIDRVAGEFDVNNGREAYSDTIELKRISEGEHIVQFVQFDGADVSFCQTKHINVE